MFAIATKSTVHLLCGSDGQRSKLLGLDLAIGLSTTELGFDLLRQQTFVTVYQTFAIADETTIMW